MIDATTWTVLGLTLTLLGLIASVLVWRRRGIASGLRAVAWSLLPAAAGLTGLLRLVADVVDSVVFWAVHLVFSPVVWLGIALVGVSVALFATSALLRARGVGRRPDRRTPPTGAERPAVTAKVDDDLADIEAILRKHGIS